MQYGAPCFDRSLITMDIPGAQTRSRHQYMNRLLPNQLHFQDYDKMTQNVYKFNSEDYKFGRRRYQHDFHHFNQLVVPQGERHFSNTQKKHYKHNQIDDSEIKYKRALENHYDPPMQLQVDRILCTNDIEGAHPGTLVSKVIRNKDIAQRIKQQREEIRYQRSRDLYQSSFQEESVTPIAIKPEYSPPQERYKSHSVQQSPNYDYMNNLAQSRIPAVESMKFNPISNKFQLKPIERNYIQDDYQKTIKLLSQQRPTQIRLHV